MACALPLALSPFDHRLAGRVQREKMTRGNGILSPLWNALSGWQDI